MQPTSSRSQDDGADQAQPTSCDLGHAELPQPSGGRKGSFFRTVTVAALSTSFFSGCQAPQQSLFVSVDPGLLQCLRVDSRLALTKIEDVEAKLITIDKFRCDHALIITPFLLLSPTLNEGYNKCIAHHAAMCAEATERKLKVLSGSFDSTELNEFLEWGTKMDDSLQKIIALLDHVASDGSMPYGWTAPEGFEYIVEYRNRFFGK
jgi:hypothetical protein